MRKLHISLLISLLLLLAQQGAVLHEMSHMGHAATVGASVQADNHLDKACELCLAFSQVANPVGATVNVTSFAPSACAASSNVACCATPADVPTPRSRGPPTPELT